KALVSNDLGVVVLIAVLIFESMGLWTTGGKTAREKSPMGDRKRRARLKYTAVTPRDLEVTDASARLRSGSLFFADCAEPSPGELLPDPIQPGCLGELPLRALARRLLGHRRQPGGEVLAIGRPRGPPGN